MHLPFAQLVVMPVSAGLLGGVAMMLVHRVRLGITRNHHGSGAVPPSPSGKAGALLVVAWLVSVGIYLWTIPGSRLTALHNLAVGEGVISVLCAVMFGLLAVLSVLFSGQRPR